MAQNRPDAFRTAFFPDAIEKVTAALQNFP
jgi:hypothetical protein